MTCVVLTLNRSDPPEPWRFQDEPRPQPSGPRTASIMVVEDDDTVREVVARMLEFAGYDVVTAMDGVAALDLLQSQPLVDLLVTDIRMPRMGGHALSLALLERRPDLPVIYITGYGGEWDPDQSAAPARAFLRKPFTEDDLLRAVRTLLDR